MSAPQDYAVSDLERAYNLGREDSRAETLADLKRYAAKAATVGALSPASWAEFVVLIDGYAAQSGTDES